MTHMVEVGMRLFPHLSKDDVADLIMQNHLKAWTSRMDDKVDEMIANHGVELKDFDHIGWQQFKQYADDVDMPGICYLTTKRMIRNRLA